MAQTIFKQVKFKFFALLLIGLFTTTLTSCNNDDDPSAASIVGSWSAIDNDIDVFANGSRIPDIAVQSLLRQSGVELSEIFDDDSILEFKADGTYEARENPTAAPETGSYSVSADGKTLTLRNDFTFSIISLTETNLELESQIIDEFEDGGQTVEIRADINVEFERIK
jgi:hypothetical protein